MAGMDTLVFAFALYLAFAFRFEFYLSPVVWGKFETLLIYSVPIKIWIFFYLKLYRGMYRYFSLSDALLLVKAVIFSSVLLVLVVFLFHRLEGFSRAVFVLDGLLTLIFTGSLRLSIRLYYSHCSSAKVLPIFGNGGAGKASNIIIIGAGDAGEKLLREMYDNNTLSSYRVVGFLDDDVKKHSRSIHGSPILGNIDDLPRIKEKYDIKEVLIAIPSANGSQMKRIVNVCTIAGLLFKTLPGLGEMVRGNVSLKHLRDVSYEDLLGREHVELDNRAIAQYVTGKTVLVTGAGGSIGSELCEQLFAFAPAQLVLLDISEENLFRAQMNFKREHPHRNFRIILGSICDVLLLERIFSKYAPEIVFHAAAYKHVPMVETNPWEAVFNNINGSRRVMEMAVKYGVEKFVLVSTDKAVNPSNVMGASKRVVEMLMRLFDNERTQFIAVRFGNVVGSSGSVIPLFREQISKGGPVTVTHPEVTRYFMTIGEAAQLIIQAGALGRGGEIFILKMGEAVKIARMAEDLIRLSGKEPYKDIEIVYTGLREGEKLYEELITHGEDIVPSEHEKIMVLRDVNLLEAYGGLTGYASWLEKCLQNLYEAAAAYDAPAIKGCLKEIIPEYAVQENRGVL